MDRVGESLSCQVLVGGGGGGVAMQNMAKWWWWQCAQQRDRGGGSMGEVGGREGGGRVAQRSGEQGSRLAAVNWFSLSQSVTQLSLICKKYL